MNRWLGKSLSFALVLSCLAGPFPAAGPAHASPKEEVLLQESFDRLQFTALERIGQDAADPSNSKQISVTPSSIALTDRRSAGNLPSTYVQLKMNDAVSFKPAIRASNYTLNVDLVDDPVPASRPNKVLWVRSSNNDVNRLVGFVFKEPQKGRIVYEADVYNPGKQEVKLYLEANSPIALRDDIQQVISGVEPSLRIQPNGNVRLPNDQSIGQVESSRWYRVRLTVNTETGLFKTQVYDKETEVLTASYEYNVPGKLRVDFAENGLLHVGLANKIYGPEGLYLDNVKIYKDLSEASTLAAKEASFYLDSPEDTPVEFNPNGNRVTAIRHGNEKLQEGVDYTVEGSRVVLHKEALQAIEQAVSGDVEDLFYSNAHPSSFSADPSVLKASDGRYYLYPTSGFKVWSSTDLFHWELAGSVWPEGTWGKSAYWAPEVVEHDGKYYMYYTASIGDSADKKYVGVAIGDSPTGPFKDIGHPIHQQFPHIDGHLFQDDDGRKYLYFSRAASHNEVDGLKQSWTYVAELNDDMISLKSDPVFLIKAEQDWELQSLPENMIWNEGPEMIKHNGLYYLMYSANSYARPQYSVGYATSTSPMGPFVKYENNPILSREEWVGAISGPGHHHFAKSPDGQELIMVYHTHVDPILAGGNRQIYIDRMGFREDGTIYVNGPTLTDQPMPSGVQGIANIAPQAAVTVSSTQAPYRPDALTDGEIGVYQRFEQYEWASGEGPGAWAKLEWQQAQPIYGVSVYDSAVPNRRIRSGHLLFDDGQVLPLTFPSEPGAAAIATFPEKKVKWVKVIADELEEAGGSTGLSEIMVLSKNPDAQLNTQTALTFEFDAGDDAILTLNLTKTRPAVRLTGSGTVDEGQPLEVGVQLSNPTTGSGQSIRSAEMTLRYDPAWLEYDSFQNLHGDTVSAAVYRMVPGELRLQASSSTGILGLADLLKLRFQAKDVAHSQSGSIRLEEARLVTALGTAIHAADFLLPMEVRNVPKLVQAITVTGDNGTSVISGERGTLQMQAAVLPEEADDKRVAWSVSGPDGGETGLAVIDEAGLLTGLRDGKVKVTARALDGSGITGTAEVTIDRTPPVTRGATSPSEPGGKNGWYTSEVTVTLSAEDGLSGVAKTEYQVNGGEWKEWTGSLPAFGEGRYTLRYRSTDLAGNVEPEQTLAFQVDLTAPTLALQLDTTRLWPANHKLVTVRAVPAAGDSLSGVESVKLTSITSSEPDSGEGDIRAELDTPAAEFQLRAERQGTGTGRIYTVTYTVTDAAGHSATAEAIVTVPHNP